MLDIKFIRQNPEEVKEGLKKRNFDVGIIDDILVLDSKWREILKELEEGRAEMNRSSKEKPSPEEIENLKKLKNKLKDLEDGLAVAEKNLEEKLYSLPNLPLPDAPVGKDEKDNKVLYEVGKKPKFNFEPKKHYELGESLGIIDTERAAKVSGSRFGYLKGRAALLEFALMNFALKKLIKKGFIPIIPPVLIKEEMLKGMGYIDTGDDREERYYLEKDKQYLVGTSEQSIGPMHSGEVFDEKDLPLRYVGFSSCFRREAGSHGKDVRGILRVHQFDKLEMFSYSRPEDSVREHKFLLAVQEELVKDLGLAYRVVGLSTGDLARPSAATFDVETWFPGLGEYKETHSCSNMTDFQARRLNIRLRRKNGDLEFVHMLNGTAFAVGRTILAILENYQQKDGTIKIPKILKKYL
ncbi:MAG: serine--tRNA ligase [Parcubacteria group bacterium]|nr:serine--tRNA ligase [Parcubacteria group bacterium]